MNPHWTLIPLLLSIACGDKDDDAVDTADSDTVPTGDDDDDTTTDTDTTTAPVECGDAAPVLANVVISNGGLVDPGTGGPMIPSLLLTIDITDADGDLVEPGFEVDLDPVIDGTLTPIGTLAGTASTGEAECSLTALQLGLAVAVDGTNVTFDTMYELGVRVLDDAGHTSTTFETTAITPNEDGTDGDGV